MKTLPPRPNPGPCPLIRPNPTGLPRTPVRSLPCASFRPPDHPAVRPGVPETAQTGADDYVQGIEAGDRTLLSRAITLVESDAPAHFQQAQEVLTRIMPRTGNAVRIGITGVPGVGKSTFIEAFGLHLCGSGHRVAVLAVDPSSSLTRGSILGDKTRMERLSREPNCFIRPSPSSGHLGGVTRKSRETLLLCEAAGFDVILIETVGRGPERGDRSLDGRFLPAPGPDRGRR